MRKRVAWLAGVIGTTSLIWAAEGLSQALEIYDSEVTFLAQAPITSTETFDAIPTGTRYPEWSIIFDDVFYEIANGANYECAEDPQTPCWIIIDETIFSGPPPVSMPNMLISQALEEFTPSGGYDTLHFGGGNAVGAFGFYFHSVRSYQSIIDNSPDFTGWVMAVHECDGTITSLDLPPEVAAAATYFGFISRPGICQIEVGSKGPQTLINWSYDSVSRSEIYPYIQAVDISIRPRKINPRSHGLLRVDLLSSFDFDALQVDLESIRFGRGEAEVIRSRARDVNKDGLADLRLRFKVKHVNFECDDTEASLTGQTYNGDFFAGTGQVKIVRCRRAR